MGNSHASLLEESLGTQKARNENKAAQVKELLAVEEWIILISKRANYLEAAFW